MGREEEPDLVDEIGRDPDQRLVDGYSLVGDGDVLSPEERIEVERDLGPYAPYRGASTSFSQRINSRL